MKNLFKLLFVVVCGLTTLIGCSSKSIYKYYDKDITGINFQSTDSVNFSFVALGAETTYADCLIPVVITGYAVDYDRYYTVEVMELDEDETLSPAIEGTHYEALSDKYVFRAGENIDTLVIRLNNTADLTEEVKKAKFRIIPGEGLVEGLYNSLTKEILMSNILVMPSTWNDSKSYADYLGEYSLRKHKDILEMFDLEEIPDALGNAADKTTWRSRGVVLDKYYRENEIYDENGLLIEPWL